MLKFKLPAKMLNDLLNATSMKGHIFVIPSKDGLSLSNTREEEDISVYNMIPKKSLIEYNYTEDETDVYCFMVGDILPLTSRMQSNVTLKFDKMVDNKKSYVHVASESGRFKGRATLKDEETMEDTLGLTPNKLTSRVQKEIKIGEQIFIIPEVIYNFGECQLLEFENKFQPLIVESDDVVLTVSQKEMKEVIKTSTSSHEFTEKFQKQQ